MVSVDVNADVGESLGPWRMGDDEALLRAVSSANIACGMHAGDPTVMARALDRAVAAGVAVGAHPGLPDLVGFGRRAMALSAAQTRDIVLYQIGAFDAMARAAGVRPRHVKLHGALYWMAEESDDISAAVVDGVRAFDPSLLLVAYTGGRLGRVAAAAGMLVAHEVFADRAIDATGRPIPRTEAGAVIEDSATAAARAVEIVTTGRAILPDGSSQLVRVDTLCVHGDTASAVETAHLLRAGLDAAGVAVRPAPGSRS